MKKQTQKPIKDNMLSFDRQTRLSWATLFCSFEDVTPQYQPFFADLQKNGKSFPYAVTTPSYEGFMHKSPEKLVCMMDDKLYIRESNQPDTEMNIFSFQDIHLIEFRSILLDSYLRFQGINQHGMLITETLRFNTVSDYLFKPFITAVRSAGYNGQAEYEVAKFAELEMKNLKFANFARHRLLKGEKVLCLIWQPELRTSFLKILIPLLYHTSLYHTVFPNHVVMLTDHELVLIHEPDRQALDDKYGGIWQYAAIRNIKSAILTSQPNNLLKLSVTLVNGTELSSFFLPELKPQLEQLVTELDKIHSDQKK